MTMHNLALIINKVVIVVMIEIIIGNGVVRVGLVKSLSGLTAEIPEGSIRYGLVKSLAGLTAEIPEGSIRYELWCCI